MTVHVVRPAKCQHCGKEFLKCSGTHYPQPGEYTLQQPCYSCVINFVTLPWVLAELKRLRAVTYEALLRESFTAG